MKIKPNIGISMGQNYYFRAIFSIILALLSIGLCSPSFADDTIPDGEIVGLEDFRSTWNRFLTHCNNAKDLKIESVNRSIKDYEQIIQHLE